MNPRYLPLALLAACAAIPHDDRSATEREVETAVETFLAAFNDLDWQAFRSSFADDASVYFPMPTAVQRADGREAIEAVFEPLFETWRAESTGTLSIQKHDLRVQLLGDDGAVVTFGVGDAGRRTMAWERGPDGWRIVHLHASTGQVEASATGR